MAHAQTSEAGPFVAGNAGVDEMIANAAPFAQPLLRYLRALIHEAAPDAAEEIKWGRPFFTVNGKNVCYIAAFTKHCSLGFWSPEMTASLRHDGLEGKDGSGSLGRISGMGDLPPRGDMLRYVRQAADEARSGTATSPMKARRSASRKAPIAVPPELADAFAASEKARAVFEGFPPSCQREYLEWVSSAKRPEPRERRVRLAIEKLEGGKRFSDRALRDAPA